MSRRRGLTPEDRDVWGRVVRSVDPLGRPAPGRGALAPTVARDPSPARTAAPAAHPAFRIGERSQTTPATHDLAPSMAETLSSAPLTMDGRTHRRMMRGKLAPEARIDLHGLTLAHAQPALAAFVASSHAAGRRLVLVITGKGRADDGDWTGRRPGALRRQVPLWLHAPPLSRIVQQVVPAHRRHGGDGALYVYLRRAR